MQVEAFIQRCLLCQQFPQLQPHRTAPFPQRCVFGDLKEWETTWWPHHLPSNVGLGGIQSNRPGGLTACRVSLAWVVCGGGRMGEMGGQGGA